jgi:hypothetical protein
MSRNTPNTGGVASTWRPGHRPRASNVPPPKRKQASSTARGYGIEHQRLRKQWAVKVAQGQAVCARCGGWISPDSEWHLDHDSFDRKRYLGPSHAWCNTTEPARRRKRRVPALNRVSAEAWL